MIQDEEKVVAYLFVIGALVAIGKMLSSNEVLTWRLMFGRALAGAGLSMSAGALLMYFPEMPMLAVLGVGSAAGFLGEQLIEAFLLNRFKKGN